MDEVADKLRNMLIEDIGLKIPEDQITMDCKLGDLGIDSFSFVKLITIIEMEFGFEFNENDLVVKNFLTFGSLVSYIEKSL